MAGILHGKDASGEAEGDCEGEALAEEVADAEADALGLVVLAAELLLPQAVTTNRTTSRAARRIGARTIAVLRPKSAENRRRRGGA